MDLSVIPYITADTEDGDVIHSKRTGAGAAVVRYKECMKNHAASLGGHANDGCGEFMPHPDPSKPFSCAACGCHRNFHRREAPGQHPPTPMLMYNAGPTTILWDRKQTVGAIRGPPLQRRVGLGPAADLGDFEGGDNDECNDDSRSETPERGDLNSFQVVGAPLMMRNNKRFRTRFTAEQKERMYEFAERVGWRMNKQDEALMNQFCSEVGVKRNVLKVWMHNNKNGRRRDSGAATTPPLTSLDVAPQIQPPPPPPPPATATQQAAGI